MDITYINHASFRLKGKTGSAITDPYTVDADQNPYPKRISADIVTVSHTHDDHNNADAVSDIEYVIQGPGEYEIKGIGVVGIAVFHDTDHGDQRGKNTIYRFDIDGVSVVHLGDLGHVLDTETAEQLDGVDVLLIPVGGVYTIGPKEAVKVINTIDPSIVVPMHFKQPGFDKGPFAELHPVTDFLQELDITDLAPIQKLKVQRESIPEDRQIVLLERK